MNCSIHKDITAIGICRTCCIAICDDCKIQSEFGFVCSEKCQARAELVDKIMNIHKAGLEAGAFRNQFAFSSFLIVLGGLLIADHLLFNSIPSTPKIVFGIIFLFVGISNALRTFYIKSRNYT